MRTLVRNCKTHALALLLFALSAVGALSAQSELTAKASITFTLDFPASDPPHYSLSIDDSGHARYESLVKRDEASDSEAYRYEFDFTSQDRERIFACVKQAKYFEGKVDSGNSKLAFTGEKTLSYRDGQRSFEQHYNYSNLAPVRDLTNVFQSTGATLEHGRKLEYFHRYQKLALDSELKSMEAQAREKQLREIQAVAPVLQEIAEDVSVISVVRARAKTILQMAISATSNK